MSAERFWARHFQDEWQARAGDPRLPRWLRVAALAYGSHTNNGHARFKRGEVALILGSIDRETGVVGPYPNVRREVALAVEFGWLEEGSYWGCLIVPAHSIRKGDMYAKPAPCPLAKTHSTKVKRTSDVRNGDLKSTPDVRFEQRTARQMCASEREPFFSDLSPVRQDRNDPTTTRESA